MDRLFSGGLSARRAHAVVLAEVREKDVQFRRDSVVHGDIVSNEKMEEAGYTIDGKHVERV